MTTGVSNRQHSTLEQMHGSFLFIAIGLISKIVKCQDRIFRRKHGSHQSRPVEFVLIRAFLDIVDQCLGCCEHPSPRVAAKKEFAGDPMNSLVLFRRSKGTARGGAVLAVRSVFFSWSLAMRPLSIPIT